MTASTKPNPLEAGQGGLIETSDKTSNNTGNIQQAASGVKEKMAEEQRLYVRRILAYFHPMNSVFELCAIGPKQQKSRAWEGFAGGQKGIVAGWYDDVEKAVDAALKLNDVGAEGIYHTLNSVDPALLGRAGNRLKAGVPRTQDKEVSILRQLLVDVDPERPAGISSSQQEHDFALGHVGQVSKDLMVKGWPAPLMADSGNGAHLVFRLPDLPNAPENVQLLKDVLEALDSLYTIRKDHVLLKVDRTVFNPARISKLYGTIARKGDHTKERPHRWARIISMPNDPQAVSLELLREMAAAVKPAKLTVVPRMNTNSGNVDFREPFRIREYLDHYSVPVKTAKDHKGSALYVLHECLFDSSHSGGEAAIGQTADGKLFYQCFHSSCQGKTWADARQVISGSDGLAQFSSLEKRGKKRKRRGGADSAGPDESPGEEESRPAELTEDAIARAFALRRKDELRFDHDMGAWFFRREDGIWHQDKTKLAFDLIRDLCHELNPADPKTETIIDGARG